MVRTTSLLTEGGVTALKRLEAAYEKFKAAGEDKKPWSSTRNGRTIYHSGRSYKEECERMKKEISNLKRIFLKILFNIF